MTVPSEEAKVRAVLLVPAEGDPHGLLTEGPCGARPPLAWQRPGIIDVGPWHPGFRYGPSRRALVLAWEGEPVAAGCLRMAVHPSSVCTLSEWHSIVSGTLRGDGYMGRLNPTEDIGTLVLLDEQGREVAS